MRERPDRFPSRLRELDVLVAVDRAAGLPLRDQLEGALRSAVRDGRLAAGTALPSTRALAVELGVSRGVVVEAYGQLAADGVLAVRPGGASRVADVPATATGRERGSAGGAAATGPAPGATASVGPPSARDATARRAPAVLDLLPLSGELAAFPRRAWARAVRRAVDGVADQDLSYGDPRGPAAARASVAAYLGRSRGVVGTVGTTALTGGVTDGLGAVGHALVDRGVRRVAVEEPGFPPHRMTLAAVGLEPVPVEVDEDGLRVDDLPADVGAVLVTAAHQTPTGRTLAPGRRAGLLRWAARTGALVIEDDYDGELRYDGPPVGALQALAPDHVAYLGSVSKTLAPALRLGWVVGPQPLVDAMATRRAVAHGGAPVLEPLALAALIDAGDLDRHVRARRRAYRRRRALVVAALDEHLAGAARLGVAAGLHVPVVLGEAVDPHALIGAAYARGVLVAAQRATLSGAERTIVAVGFGRVPDASVDRAVRALGEAVTDVAG